MPSPRAPAVPSVLDLRPQLRRPARRAAAELRRLVDALVTAFPDAILLERHPAVVERIDTVPHDHLAAHLIRVARDLQDAIAALDEPP